MFTTYCHRVNGAYNIFVQQPFLSILSLLEINLCKCAIFECVTFSFKKSFCFRILEAGKTPSNKNKFVLIFISMQMLRDGIHECSLRVSNIQTQTYSKAVSQVNVQCSRFKVDGLNVLILLAHYNIHENTLTNGAPSKHEQLKCSIISRMITK